MAGVRVPIVPFAHEYLVTQPFRERTPGEHLPTLRDPDLLIYFREEGGGLVMGGYERESAPWALDEHQLDAIPADFNGRLLEEDWPRFEEIAKNSSQTRAGDGRDHGHAPDQRARGVHARQRVLPRRERGARVLRRRRLLRARPRRRGRDRSRDGASGSSTASPRRTCGRWTSAASARTSARPATRSSAPRRSTRPTTTSATPATSARRADRCARPAPTPGTASTARPSARSPGWERVNWYESNAASGRRVAAPARLGGHALVARDRRRAPRDARARGAVRRVLVRQARDRRAGRGGRSWNRCATTAWRATSARSPTRRCSTRAAGSSATSRSRACEEELFSIVTGTAFGNHDLGWIRRHAPRDGSVRCTDVTARWACFALWGPRARDILAPI